MSKKRRRKPRKALIPKEWKVKNGITTLPGRIREQVQQVLTRLKIGAEQQPDFFDRKLSISQRQTIAYELSLSGLSYQDIATLLGVSISGAFVMLERARSEVADGLPPNWLAANFIDDYQALKQYSQWNAARAESAATDELAVAFGRNAIAARGKSGEFLLKAEEITKLIGKQNDEQADPSNRVSFLQQVFEERILPKLEPPKEAEAEIVDDEQSRVSTTVPR